MKTEDEIKALKEQYSWAINSADGKNGTYNIDKYSAKIEVLNWVLGEND